MKYINTAKKAIDKLIGKSRTLLLNKQDKMKGENNAWVTGPLSPGYTVDEEGHFNCYAIEPPIIEAAYPSEKEQQRYLYLGIAAALFVTMMLEIAFVVS